MKYATYLAADEKKRKQMDQAIGWKADNVMKIIDYAGSRGVTPEMEDPQVSDRLLGLDTSN